MKYWFTADYHLGHANIIKYCNRPFRNINEMNRAIIRNHNERVKPEDIVFHLGDFCFKNSSEQRGEGQRIPAKEWERKLNGKIIHIKGNHDKNNSTKTIIQNMVIHYSNMDIFCVHNPIDYNPKYKINFTAHVHNNWEIKEEGDIIYTSETECIILESNLINVGVDVNKFMPRTFEELIKKLKRR